MNAMSLITDYRTQQNPKLTRHYKIERNERKEEEGERKGGRVGKRKINKSKGGKDRFLRSL